MKKTQLAFAALAVPFIFSLSSCETMDTNALINLGTQIALQNTELGKQAQQVQAMKQMLDLSGDRASLLLAETNVWDMILPEEAQKIAKTLRVVGMGSYVDNVQNSMTSAAAQAAEEAGPIFKQAIKDITLTDVLGIIQGDSTAATRYFQSQTEQSLRAKINPIVTSQLQKTGYYQQYQDMINVYDRIPFMDKPNLDLETYVLNETMTSLFSRMGQEEAKIRQDPLGRGSALIDKVLKSAQAQ